MCPSVKILLQFFCVFLSARQFSFCSFPWEQKVASWAPKSSVSGTLKIQKFLSELNNTTITSAKEISANVLLEKLSDGTLACYASGATPRLLIEDNLFRVNSKKIPITFLIDILLKDRPEQLATLKNFLTSGKYVGFVVEDMKQASLSYLESLKSYINWLVPFSALCEERKEDILSFIAGQKTLLQTASTNSQILSCLKTLQKEGGSGGKTGLDKFVHTETILAYNFIQKDPQTLLDSALVFFTSRDMCEVCEEILVRLFDKKRLGEKVVVFSERIFDGVSHLRHNHLVNRNFFKVALSLDLGDYGTGEESKKSKLLSPRSFVFLYDHPDVMSIANMISIFSYNWEAINSIKMPKIKSSHPTRFFAMPPVLDIEGSLAAYRKTVFDSYFSFERSTVICKSLNINNVNQVIEKLRCLRKSACEFMVPEIWPTLTN